MKVFISHAKETRALAKRIGDALSGSGLDVWDSEQEILPGDNWAEKIGQALESSQAMVVLLTAETLSSTTVRREIEYALSSKSFNKRLIPVFVFSEQDIRFESLPWILSHLNVINLPAYGKQEEGINQITKALQAAAA